MVNYDELFKLIENLILRRKTFIESFLTSIIEIKTNEIKAYRQIAELINKVKPEIANLIYYIAETDQISKEKLEKALEEFRGELKRSS